MNDAAKARQPADLSGLKLGQFLLEARLGQGAMGVVYRAVDTQLRRTVALKLLREEGMPDPGRRRRFLREARAAAAVTHRNVAIVYEVGEVERHIYIAMELVEGITLRDVLRPGRVPLPEALRIGRAVARALSKAHERGVVHRDLKPENVMLSEDREVKVLDFGLAKLVDAGGKEGARGGEAGTVFEIDETVSHEKTGMLIGTPAYMSPEQVAGRASDARGDVFAFGVVLYEMLTGERPFQGSSAVEVMVAIARDPARPAPVEAPIPPAIERVIDRCLAKDPADRYANGREILLALETIDASAPSLSNLESLPASHAAPAMHRRRARRHEAARRATWILGAGAVLVAAVAAWLAVRGRSAASAHATSASSAAAPPGTSAVASALAAARQKDRDGRHDLACLGYERASDMDPSAAEPAFEAAARCHRGDPAVGRVYFRRAWAGRAQLSPVQAARLNAFEPVFQREPHDLPETLARFEEVVRRFPDSADARWELGLYLLNSEAGGVTRRGFTEIARALAADPVHAEWLLLDADRRAYAGDFAGAREDLQKCVRVAPEALECLEEQAWIDGEHGACDQVEVAERRIAAIDPGFIGGGGQGLASAMYAQGASTAAVEALLRRGRDGFPLAQRAALETRDQMHLAVLTGDLATAERLARVLDDAALPSPLASDHGDAAQVLVRIQVEAGLVDAASATAARYLDGRDGWEPDAFFDDWAMAKEPTPLMLATRARAGALAPAAFERAQARTMERWKARVEPYVRAFAWAHGFAAPAESAEEARAAVQRLSSPADVPSYTPLTLLDADIGRTFLLAGRVDDAVLHLERAAHSCFALAHPVEHTRAHYFLGQAREARGDTAGACAAYRVVRDRWGAARPRSVTAEKALGRMKALGCRD